MDIRNITFKFLVPRFLTKGKSIEPKSQNKATLHGKSDIVDDQNRNFWKNFDEVGIQDEVATASLLRMKSALSDIDAELQKNKFILGPKLSLLDIAWFIYAMRLQNAGYPLKKFHPNVYLWFQQLNADKSFNNEVKTPLPIRLITYLHYLFLKFNNRDIESLLKN